MLEDTNVILYVLAAIYWPAIIYWITIFPKEYKNTLLFKYNRSYADSIMSFLTWAVTIQAIIVILMIIERTL